MKNAEGYKFFVKGGQSNANTNNNNHANHNHSNNNPKTQNGGDLSAKFDESVTPSKNP